MAQKNQALEVDVKTDGVQAALAAGMRIGELEAARKMDINGTPLLILPDGMKYEDMSKLLDRPLKLECASREFIEPASFSSYVNQFKDAGTRLYGEFGETSGKVVAVLDDHETAAEPRFCRHKVTLDLQPSPDWIRWTKGNREKMNQRGFADFLEESVSCVAEPAAAQILDAARKFSVRKNKVVDSECDEIGNIKFAVSEELSGQTRNSTATLARKFVLAISPFRVSVKRYPVDALIRYHFVEGGLYFAYTLVEAEKVVEAAFADIRKAVSDATGMEVLV